MLDIERNISVTMLLIIRLGPAIKFFEPATHADNKGIVVDTGTGNKSCFILLSSINSCITNANSILIDVKPPPLAIFK